MALQWRMPPELAFRALSYGLIGFLSATVLVIVLISLCKENRYYQPVRGILWFALAVTALCAAVSLLAAIQRIRAFEKMTSIERVMFNIDE
jgi:hypothetical protein